MNEWSDGVNRESDKMVSQSLVELLYDLPFDEELWSLSGRQIGRNGKELLAEVRRFFDLGLIREIGPIFNAAMLGYKTTLMAASVPEDRLEEVAGIVSGHEGVSHNYLRDHVVFNLWFTLAAAGGEESLVSAIDELSQKTGVPMRRFDTIRPYKISFRLSNEALPEPSVRNTAFNTLDAAMQKRLAAAIEILQQGLPLTEHPFETLLEKLNFQAPSLSKRFDVNVPSISSGGESGAMMTVKELLACGNTLKELGILRRFGVTWRHRKIGFIENMLCVWQIPEHQIEAFVERIKGIGVITHCYRRTRYSDWPWSIYTMIHGRTRGECETIISQLCQEFSEAKYLAMRTVKEFKKQRVVYRPMIFEK